MRHLLGLILLATLPVGTASAQATPPALGLGFQTTLSSTEGLGVGLRGRASWAVNADLSMALGAGMTGFVLEGRDEATYLLDPQASVIVTLNDSGNRTPYILGGIGAAIPVNSGSNAENGPTLHFGMGYVQGLRDTILFYEINPAMIVGENEISFNIPFRIGVIF
ncbi:MAG: hypothetical protein JJ896_16400 [Rhodothermales bacterium]|nr:hypothetical protein [Rhodothermales bacterium]MBO6781238.1 hypothetical protein [Rhodothermales bacterium]